METAIAFMGNPFFFIPAFLCIGFLIGLIFASLLAMDDNSELTDRYAKFMREHNRKIFDLERKIGFAVYALETIKITTSDSHAMKRAEEALDELIDKGDELSTKEKPPLVGR